MKTLQPTCRQVGARIPREEYLGKTRDATREHQCVLAGRGQRGATAELPVLDVAAYESTLGERTDSWAVPRRRDDAR